MKTAKWTLAAAALALAAASPPAAQAAQQRVLVVTDAGVAPLPQSHLVSHIGALATWSAPVPSGSSASGYAQRLRSLPGIVAAQPNQRIHKAQGQPGLCATVAPTEVDRTIPNGTNVATTAMVATAPVAILDTGVAGDSPELAGRLVNPYNALDGGADANDLDGHGTQVAGIAAGAAPGLFRGVSQKSPIMPVKIFNQSGDSSAQILVKGINRAVSAGAGVINISGAGPASDVSTADMEVVELAIDNAYGHGVLVVVAAGNDGSNKPYVPGNLNHTLNVGGGSSVGGRSTFSNTGPWIDLVSPAESLNPPMPPSVCSTGYGPANGTSFASPAVAGAVVLVKALRPELGTQQLFDLMRTSAKDIAPDGRDDDTGYGSLDVESAVAAPTPSSDKGELDDDVFWLKGPFAAKHPVMLRKSRLVRKSGTVSATKDATDVWPVYVRKNQTLTARVTGKSDALLDVGIYDPKTGSFDITKGRETHLLAATAGFSAGPETSVTVDRTGTYYVAVDTVEPGDAEADGDDAAKVKDLESYKLTISKPSAKKKAKKKKKKK